MLLRILDGTGGTTCATSTETKQICAALNLTDASPAPVSGPDGAALLTQARAQHYDNVDLIDMATAGIYRDYVNGPESWTVASVGSKTAAIAAGGVPILTYAGWLDAGTADGVLSQFASLSNTQNDWIGPWSHGQGYLADPLQPSLLLTAAEHAQIQDEMFAFFDRYVKDGDRPDGTRVLHYYTLNQGQWHTPTASFPVPGTRLQDTADGALYAYLEDLQPDGKVVYVTESELALTDQALAAHGDNPAWARLRTPRSHTQAAASPFPAGISQQITFDLLPTSVLFRAGDRIRITISAADPDNFQMLPANGTAAYRISSLTDPSFAELPIVG